MGSLGICWRSAIAFLLGAAFFAPLVSTFATSAPMTAEAVVPNPRFVGIRVHLFDTFEGGGCLPTPPMPTLHVGPLTFTGNRDTVDWVNRQVRGAALRCLPVWLGGFTVEITINDAGRAERVTFDRDVDPWITRCVGPLLRDGWYPEDPPGRAAATVRAGYLMRMTRD